MLTSNGVTVGVEAPATTGLGENGCALGWFQCGSDGGGGCCPSGYACGESCTATGVNLGAGETGTATVAKNNGSGGGKTQTLSIAVWKAGLAVSGMILVTRLIL